MRFVGVGNADDRARIEGIKARAASCAHSFRRYKGPVPAYWEPPFDCFGFDVPEDTQYHVERCDRCDARRDVTPEGELLREYLHFGRVRGIGIIDAADDPSDYEPRFDGIDSFGESEDRSIGNPIADLFDARGGVGDEY